jgi:hypothetical protein
VAGPLNYVGINPEDQMHGAAAVEVVHPHQLRRRPHHHERYHRW